MICLGVASSALPMINGSPFREAALQMAPPWQQARLLAYHEMVLRRGQEVMQQLATPTPVPVVAGPALLQLQEHSSTSFASIIMCIIIIILAVVDAILALIAGALTNIIIFAGAPPAFLETRTDDDDTWGTGGARLPSLASIFEEIREQGSWEHEDLDIFGFEVDGGGAAAPALLQTGAGSAEVEAVEDGELMNARHRFLISVSGGCQGTIGDLAGRVKRTAIAWKNYAITMRKEGTADMSKFLEVSSETWEAVFSNDSSVARQAVQLASNRSSSAAEWIRQLPRRPSGTIIDCTNGMPLEGRCECFPGFEGEACTSEVGCGANCTSDRHVCMFGLCLCLPGHTGPECAAVFDDCGASRCSGHGSCSAGLCACDSGFTGEDCSVQEQTPVEEAAALLQFDEAIPRTVGASVEEAMQDRINDLTARLKVLGGDGLQKCMRSGYAPMGPDDTALQAGMEDGAAAEDSKDAAAERTPSPEIEEDAGGGRAHHPPTAARAIGEDLAPPEGQQDGTSMAQRALDGESTMEGTSEGGGSGAWRGMAGAPRGLPGLADAPLDTVLLSLREGEGEGSAAATAGLVALGSATRFMCGPTKAVLKWVKGIECKFAEKVRKHIEQTPHAEGPGAAMLELQSSEASYARAKQRRAAPSSTEERALEALKARLQHSGADSGMLHELLRAVPAVSASTGEVELDGAGAPNEGGALLQLAGGLGLGLGMSSGTQGLGSAIGDTASTFIQLILVMVEVIRLILAP